MSEITVYADILFLVNFSMDLMSLYFTGRVLHKRINTGRLCAAASFGGVAATVATVLCDSSSFLGNALLTAVGFLLSTIMTLISFGRYTSVKQLLRDSVVLWGAGALLGGVMTYVLSLGNPVFIKTGGAASFSMAFAMCFLISYVITRMISSVRRKKTVVAVLEAGGLRADFTALCDSGNIASEPISGMPVVVVSYTVCGEFYRMVRENDERLKIRAIPLKSLGGERLLMGFIADKLTVGGTEYAAVVAIDGENRSFGGFGAIVPASLCGENFFKRRVKEDGQKTFDSVHD